tara:strand:- start:27 stop:5114 length:5088 start_codon:yes stop_codon:yes gene_type:complete
VVHLRNLRLNQTTLAALLVALFIVPSLLPIVSADDSDSEETSARNSQLDFTFRNPLFVSESGSAIIDGALYLEPGTHKITANISATGSGSGDLWLVLQHKGSPILGFTDVPGKTISLGTQTGNGGTIDLAPVTFTWNATTGAGQELRVKIQSTNEAGNQLLNNIQALPVSFSVENKHFGEVSSNNLPTVSTSTNRLVMSETTNYVNMTVTNSGVKALSAQLTVTLTHNATATIHEIDSNTVLLEPGSFTFTPVQESKVLSAELDIPSLGITGVWNISITVTFSGTGWTSDPVAQPSLKIEEWVKFSDFNAEILQPSTIVAEPGETVTVTFVVKNTGAANDRFNIAMSESISPAWTSGVAPSFGPNDLAPGAIRLVSVDVNIPSSAQRSMTDTLTLTFTSQASTDMYTITAVGRVMVGDFFKGEAVFEGAGASAALPIIPGGSANFTVRVYNNGSVSSAFTLNSGFGVNALNWTMEVGTLGSTQYTTRVIPSGGTEIVQVKVIAPPIQSPIVTSEHNTADDLVGLWVTCQPLSGGLPSIDNASVKVSPTIVVDPGINTQPQTVTSEQLAATLTGTIISRNPALNLRVFHNLPLDDTPGTPSLRDETLNATIDFTTNFESASDGGFSEASRWDVSLTNPIYNGLLPNASRNTTLNIAGPPGGEYPLAGTFTVSVTVTPQLSAALEFSQVSAVAVTRDYTLVIPSIVSGEFLGPNYPQDVDVGIENQIPLQFANTGNDVSSYRLRVIDDELPENWIANFSETDTIIDNLTSDISDGTVDSGTSNANVTHTSIVTLNVRTDSLAPSGLVQPIPIQVEDPYSGQIIGQRFIVYVVVGQVFDASLSPTNHTEQLEVTKSEEHTIFVSNTGNSPADYTISIDTSQAGDVEFEIVSPVNNKLFIAAGYEDSIRVRMTANANANYDEFYMATVSVSSNNGQILLYSNIVANITENHSFVISAIEELAVTPGTDEDIDFNLTNRGNLEESISINFTVEGDLSLSDYTMTETVPINQSYSDQITVTIPELTSSDSMAQGDSYNLTITVLSSAGAEYSKHVVKLIVQPLFIVESSDWPAEMKFMPESDRTWEVTLTNTGNRDVTVSAAYTITRPGLSNLSDDWKMVSQPTTIDLPRNTPVVHTFTVVGMVPNPLLSLSADLTIFLQPLDLTVQGSGEFSTQLVMSRFYSVGEIGLAPNEDDNEPVDVTIPHTHIPVSNTSEAAYEVELCDAQRLLDIDSMGLVESEHSWNFTLVEQKADGSEVKHLLDLEQECGLTSLGPTSRYPLLEQIAWDTSDIKLEVDIPDRGFILPGDGWNLTFRLYHPDENGGYTQYDEETFTLVLAVFADPMVKSIFSNDGYFEEGTDTTITVVIQNVGSASALDVVVDLQCDILTVSNKANEQPLLYNRSVNGGVNLSMIPYFFPGDSLSLQWVVKAESIDWWSQRAEATCVATLNASYMDGNIKANDQLSLIEDVKSQSPGVSNSFIACIVFMLVSVILFRLTDQNENFRLLGIYAGVVALGFSFHIFQYAWWGFVVLGITALWIWRVSWGSTEEFRLLHEDYQRARKGVSTLYSDHFEELADTRRQLSVILAVPVLGMLAVVLGLPPSLSNDQTNLVSLVSYIAVVMIGVWIIIKRADSSYGSLYGRLTDIEVKSVRIERDLSDPARLFNELALEGLNIDEIFGELEPPMPANIEAPGTTEEVSEDV